MIWSWIENNKESVLKLELELYCLFCARYDVRNNFSFIGSVTSFHLEVIRSNKKKSAKLIAKFKKNERRSKTTDRIIWSLSSIVNAKINNEQPENQKVSVSNIKVIYAEWIVGGYAWHMICWHSPFNFIVCEALVVYKLNIEVSWCLCVVTYCERIIWAHISVRYP